MAKKLAVEEKSSSLASDLASHLRRVAEAGQRQIAQVTERQARTGSGKLSKKFPCPTCRGFGLLETLTFYSPVDEGGVRVEAIEWPNDDAAGAFGATGAARCFSCDGSGVDYRKAGAAKMADVVKLVKG